MKNTQKNINYSSSVMCTKGPYDFHNITATHIIVKLKVIVFNTKLHISHLGIRVNHNTLSFMWEICYSPRVLIHNVLHNGHLVGSILFSSFRSHSHFCVSLSIYQCTLNTLDCKYESFSGVM